jgi:hypothetical protein
LPSVDPAFDLAAALDEFDASVDPAFVSWAFEGLDPRALDITVSSAAAMRAGPARTAPKIRPGAGDTYPLESKRP